jgi:hypothetical protein
VPKSIQPFVQEFTVFIRNNPTTGCLILGKGKEV